MKKGFSSCLPNNHSTEAQTVIIFGYVQYLVYSVLGLTTLKFYYYLYYEIVSYYLVTKCLGKSMFEYQLASSLLEYRKYIASNFL